MGHEIWQIVMSFTFMGREISRGAVLEIFMTHEIHFQGFFKFVMNHENHFLTFHGKIMMSKPTMKIWISVFIGMKNRFMGFSNGFHGIFIFKWFIVCILISTENADNDNDEEADSFTTQKLFSFAWQIAKGMVGINIANSK